jgi:transposase
VNLTKREELRKALLERTKSDPEGVVDLVLSLMDQVEERTKRAEKLEDQLKKDSSNSSKPPSSDGPGSKPKKTRSLRGKSGKKSGGQLGHKGHRLEPRQEPDTIIEHRLKVCPVTGRRLSDTDVVSKIRCQVFDIPDPKMEVTEHVYFVYSVPNSKKTVHQAYIHGASQRTQYGPRFGSLLVYLKDYQLIPLLRITQLCFDLYGQKISQATIDRFRKPCSEHLERFEAHLKKQLLNSPVLHSDETGIRIGKKTQWLHVLCTEEETLLWTSAYRGRRAIDEMGILHDFKGTLVHDCWSSYFTLDCEHALCNAHLLRELAFFVDIKASRWAQRMTELLRQALGQPQMTSTRGWKQRYANILAAAEKENPYTAPVRKKGQRGRTAKPAVNNLIERFKKHRESILRFITDQAVPFTNNQAERDLRMAKVQQKISGTFRTQKGAQIFARIRSYISTAQKKGVSVYHALLNAIEKQPMFC